MWPRLRSLCRPMVSDPAQHPALQCGCAIDDFGPIGLGRGGVRYFQVWSFKTSSVSFFPFSRTWTMQLEKGCPGDSSLWKESGRNHCAQSHEDISSSHESP